jgi:hypothetical protein
MRASWPAFSSSRAFTVSTTDAGQRPSSHFVPESSILSEGLNVWPPSAAVSDAGVFKSGCRLRVQDEDCNIEGEGEEKRVGLTSVCRIGLRCSSGPRASSDLPIVIQVLKCRFLGGSWAPPDVQNSTDIGLLLQFQFNCVVINTGPKVAPTALH